MVRIFVEEEYGFRYWQWDFPGSAADFEKWFSELPSVSPFYQDPAAKIAELNLGEVKNLAGEDYLAFLDDVVNTGYQFYLHLHEDDDSLARRLSDGGEILHAGYPVEKR